MLILSFYPAFHTQSVFILELSGKRGESKIFTTDYTKEYGKFLFVQWR